MGVFSKSSLVRLKHVFSSARRFWKSVSWARGIYSIPASLVSLLNRPSLRRPEFFWSKDAINQALVWASR